MLRDTNAAPRRRVSSQGEGEAGYVDDISPPGCLVAKLSAPPRAGEAPAHRRHSGAPVARRPCGVDVGRIPRREPPAESDGARRASPTEVGYLGEAVALVAAESARRGRGGGPRRPGSYEPLPGLFPSTRPVRPAVPAPIRGGERLFGERGSGSAPGGRRGDLLLPAAGFARAEVLGVLAAPDARGRRCRLTGRAPARQAAALVLGLPPERCRLVAAAAGENAWTARTHTCFRRSGRRCRESDGPSRPLGPLLARAPRVLAQVQRARTWCKLGAARRLRPVARAPVALRRGGRAAGGAGCPLFGLPMTARGPVPLGHARVEALALRTNTPPLLPWTAIPICCSRSRPARPLWRDGPGWVPSSFAAEISWRRADRMPAGAPSGGTPSSRRSSIGWRSSEWRTKRTELPRQGDPAPRHRLRRRRALHGGDRGGRSRRRDRSGPRDGGFLLRRRAARGRGPEAPGGGAGRERARAAPGRALADELSCRATASEAAGEPPPRPVAGPLAPEVVPVVVEGTGSGGGPGAVDLGAPRQSPTDCARPSVSG